jgi:hypothetical protein
MEQEVTLYRWTNSWWQKKFSFDAYTPEKDVALSYWDNIQEIKVKPKKLADVTKDNKVLDIIQKNWSWWKYYDVKDIVNKKDFSLWTNVYEIFDDPKVLQALKKEWYDYIKFNDFNKKFKPHISYIPLSWK